jgi:trehalose-6-phosphate synthase
MKKIAFLILTIIMAVGAQAQTVNQDTLAKYSKKEEQLKVFNALATDIHLDKPQREQFNQLSLVYAKQAISVLGIKNNSRRQTMQALRKIGAEYYGKLKVLLTPAQLDLMKGEREKYHFVKRFLAS